MKILYGICGEGMGHATRSQVVLQHLRSRGHEVLVAASGQALHVLQRTSGVPASAKRESEAQVSGSVLRSGSSSRAAAVEHPPSAAAALADFNDRARVRAEREAREGGESLFSLLPIVGLGMRCKDGAMDLRGTIEENAQRLPAMLRENAAAWAEADRFQPDAAITDYDSFVWLFGVARGIPIVSIDNAQVLPRCVHREDAFPAYRAGMRALEAFTVAKTPSAQHYVVTSFFYPPVKPHLRQTTTLVPPILRGEVLRKLDEREKTNASLAANAAPVHGTFVVVYKTGSLDDASVLGPLARVPEQRFLVYGLRGDTPVPDNVIAKPFSTDAFLTDLAASRAVIGNAGMSLLGETLAFGKPVYVIPVRGQFEQVLNACYLEKLGYGITSETLDPNRLRAFLATADTYAANIARVPQHDRNERLYGTLDALFPPNRGR